MAPQTSLLMVCSSLLLCQPSCSVLFFPVTFSVVTWAWVKGLMSFKLLPEEFLRCGTSSNSEGCVVLFLSQCWIVSLHYECCFSSRRKYSAQLRDLSEENSLRAMYPGGDANGTFVNSADFTKKLWGLQIQCMIFPCSSITCYFIALFALIKTSATK